MPFLGVEQVLLLAALADQGLKGRGHGHFFHSLPAILPLVLNTSLENCFVWTLLFILECYAISALNSTCMWSPSTLCMEGTGLTVTNVVFPEMFAWFMAKLLLERP